MQYYFAYFKNNAVSYWREFANINNNEQENSNMVTREAIHFIHRDVSHTSFILQIGKFLRLESSGMWRHKFWSKSFTLKLEVSGSTKTLVHIYQKR
jgi:hypothetical protein